jgi:hypothetical protein
MAATSDRLTVSVAMEVDSLDEAVRGQEGGGADLDGCRVVAEAHQDPGRRRNPGVKVAQQGLLPDLTERGRERKGQSEALRIVVWQVT